MSRFKSVEEMEAIRRNDAVLREQQMKDFVPEKNQAKPVAYFQIDRYYKGNINGCFIVSQLITEDSRGKALKKPIRKVVADGVDMVVAISSLETALRRKVFK